MKVRILTAVLAFGLLALGSSASAKEWKTRVGGHFGVAVPLFQHAASGTIYLNNLSMKIPVAIHVQTSPAFTFEFETMFSLPQGQDEGSIWFTPGFTYDFGGIIEAGLKFVWAIDPFIPTPLNKEGARIDLGLMPVLQKTWNLGGASYYLRLDFPILVRDEAKFSMLLHTGISF